MMVRAIALAGALATAAQSLSAQEPQDTFALEEIVVTATRTPQPRAAIPAHVSVLRGETLRARGITRVDDALRAAGAGSIAQIGAPGAAASLFLRGGESDYVQVLIDGVQVNDPGGAFDWAHLTTADIDRIEVVRGPVSVLYGSDAVVGVVQIFTLAGADAPRLEAELSAGTGARVGAQAAGSFTTWNGSVSLAGVTPVAQAPLAWGITAARQASGGVYAFNNDYDNTTLSGRGSYVLRGGTSLALSGRFVDQRFHYPTDGAGTVVDRNRYTDGTSRALSAVLGQPLGSALRAQLTISAYRSETGGNDPEDSPGQGDSRSGARVRRESAELRLDAALPHGFELSVGVELEQQGGRTWFRSGGPFPFADSSRDERGNRAGYVQLVGGVGRAALTGGVRLDHSDQFGSFPTARVGATLSLTRAVSLHGAFGTGFKEPTFFETYATGFARGNPELEPEESRSVEIGARAATGALRVAVTAFDQRFRNLIQYTAAPPAPDAPNYFNVGRSQARGIETDAGMTVGSLTVSASHTWLDTEVLDDGFGADPQFIAGEPLLRRPAHQLALRADVQASARLRAGARLRRVGEREDLDFTDFTVFPAPRVTLPSYTLLDLDVGYALPLPRGDATLRLGVENLADERYADIYNFPRPGRVFTAGVRYGLTL